MLTGDFWRPASLVVATTDVKIWKGLRSCPRQCFFVRSFLLLLFLCYKSQGSFEVIWHEMCPVTPLQVRKWTFLFISVPNKVVEALSLHLMTDAWLLKIYFCSFASLNSHLMCCNVSVIPPSASFHYDAGLPFSRLPRYKYRAGHSFRDCVCDITLSELRMPSNSHDLTSITFQWIFWVLLEDSSLLTKQQRVSNFLTPSSCFVPMWQKLSVW